jgi:selenocysteine lyase/cysteine desulfurase
MLSVLDPRRVIFTANATGALNLAIHGLLRPGDHVVATVCEHNSVLRPLADAQRRLGVKVSFVPCDANGVVSPDEVASALRSTTRMVCITHASNVTGAIQPVADVAAAAHEAGAFVLVDAAQTLGHIPVDFYDLGADLLAAAAHKGPLGPLGAGLLAIREGLETELQPIQQGGRGVESQSDSQGLELPTRYESGSLNAPALAGLAAGVDELRNRGIDRVAVHEAGLTQRLWDGLMAIDGVRPYGPDGASKRAPVVSFSAQGYDPQELALALDAVAGIECRAGLHCAPKMHAALGTLESGGLVRFSLGWATKLEEIDRVLESVARLVAV